MGDFTVKLSGLKELSDDMEKLISHYPDEVNKSMTKAAREWKKDCDAKMPDSYGTGKGHIKKNWKTETEKGDLGVVTRVSVSNQGAHFHWVENGHRKFDFHGHDTGGFVPGKHYAEKTRAEYETKFPEMIQATADRLLKGSNL